MEWKNNLASEELIAKETKRWNEFYLNRLNELLIKYTNKPNGNTKQRNKVQSRN
jgi:hypothetical protein